ncbi:histidine kinase [Niastella caeni]|uniref:Histidine kinase n=1 Tax=Niastella caeni TaxID=2569763 RepID=A0A4S8HXF1_9BACT|nr:two-component regulator propeller domain-containing protein [Niastella caeni]THU39459.1 histidine kinase [Niastella caeni]
MKLFVLTVLFWFVYPLAVFSQEYGYTHYDNKEGLAGSTVYCMAKDKDGFLWFGTEGGLSRFDGTHFKNFTREDGLPDNEVIKLFVDSKGRVWMAPFKKTICYYYKGKIYTPDNDPVLQRIRVSDFVIQFAEDKAGNMLLMESKKLQLVDTTGHVTVIDSINGAPIIQLISGISANAEGGFMVIYEGNLYNYRNNRFQQRKAIPSFSFHSNIFAMNSKLLVRLRDAETTEVVSFEQDRSVAFPFKNVQILYSIIDDSLVGRCLQSGAVIYNINGSDSPRYFLKDLPVSSILKDAEDNIWFSTLGHGVYKLSSPFVLNVKLRKNNSPSQALAFTRYKQNLLASTNLRVIYSVSRITGKLQRENAFFADGLLNPITQLNVYKEKYIIAGAATSLFKLGPDFKKQKEIYPVVVKGIFPYRDKLFVAAKDNVLVVDPETFKITDTIWHERSTSVFVSNDTVYIGALGGLYCSLPDKTKQFLGEKVPALKTRITTIQKDSTGVLWIGTYGDGLIGYKNNRIVASLNRSNGLTSNVCRTLYLQGNFLWVGTDKGISKINITRPDYPVTKYTTSDGLASDIINAIYVDSNKVFVGTSEGYTFFDEAKIISQSRCDLLFTDITMGGVHYGADSIPAVIAHEKNNVRFDYIGISYKSGGDIRYRYRLLELDSAWHETRETFLSYPILPSGNYQLQLQAINKFDVHSKLLTARFAIEKLLYEKTWFQVLIGFIFLAAVGLLITVIVRRIRKREQEKTAFSKRISELEQLSRKAQMNPHFIFNSLNSIQHYVMEADVVGANKFISGFSRLIRQTLDFSSKPEISLEEELDYLTNYLEIEKTRLENAFSWFVSIEKGVEPAEYYIPPMLLQPFVENSVRHGLRFRRDKDGIVTITVKQENDNLIVILEDNGIGRKAAMQYKSISPINYQSKGLSLTADRIDMFNKEHERKITMYIDDLEDNFHNSLGTRVTISFPIF